MCQRKTRSITKAPVEKGSYASALHHARGGAVQELVDGLEELLVAVLGVLRELVLAPRDVADEVLEGLEVVELARPAAVSHRLQIAGVHDLLELALQRDREHRL